MAEFSNTAILVKINHCLYALNIFFDYLNRCNVVVVSAKIFPRHVCGVLLEWQSLTGYRVIVDIRLFTYPYRSSVSTFENYEKSKIKVWVHEFITMGYH